MAKAEPEKGTESSSGTVHFLCPKCLKATITRSRHERKIAAAYTCPSCAFTGPN